MTIHLPADSSPREGEMVTTEVDGTVVCPCHMGTFDITTGSVVSGPPPEPVRTWPVQEEA